MYSHMNVTFVNNLFNLKVHEERLIFNAQKMFIRINYVNVTRLQQTNRFTNKVHNRIKSCT